MSDTVAVLFARQPDPKVLERAIWAFLGTYKDAGFTAEEVFKALESKRKQALGLD